MIWQCASLIEGVPSNIANHGQMFLELWVFGSTKQLFWYPQNSSVHRRPKTKTPLVSLAAKDHPYVNPVQTHENI